MWPQVRQVPLKYLAVALLFVVIGFALLTKLDPGNESAVQPRVFDLISADSPITSIELSQGDAGVFLALSDSGWRISHNEQLEGYQVNPVKVVGLIRFIRSAKIIEKKTARQEKLQSLGLSLQPDNSDVSTPVLLSVSSASVNERVLIGNRAQSGQGTYMRFPEKSQAWLVSGEVDLPVDVLEWLTPVFINIDRADIARVKFVSPTGAEVIVSASDKTESAVIENMPEGATLAYGSIADSALASLINLRLLDVRRADQISWQDSAQADFDLVSGASILVRCVEQNGKYWVHVNRDGISDHWGYAVDEYRFSQLTKEMSDYISPP